MFNVYLFNEPLYNATIPPSGVHLVLGGRYITDTPQLNRIYVIGRDDDINPVYGTALKQSEIDLVGERLDFRQRLDIHTTANANSVAQAMLDKLRITASRGYLEIPPNCAVELWDVITTNDDPCNQQAAKHRIIGIRFDYEPARARYSHVLILGAP